MTGIYKICVANMLFQIKKVPPDRVTALPSGAFKCSILDQWDQIKHNESVVYQWILGEPNQDN